MAVEDIVIRMKVEGEEELQQALKVSGMSMRQFNTHLQKNALRLNENNKVIDKFTNKQLKTTDVMRRGMYQARRFKMEWLSIMFAGMALSRVFGGLVKTQMQLFGVIDMLNAAWTLVFLPIMELITPILYKLLDIFMDMPESLKLAVGAFVILAAVIGLVLMVVGQVFLGIMGFALLGPIVGTIIGIIGIFAAVLIGIILIVKGIYDIFKGKFEGIGTIIMGIGAILLLFIGWWALIPIAVGLAVYLIIKHWDKIKEWFSKFWEWLKNAAKNAWNFVLNIFRKSPFGIIMGIGRKVLGGFQAGGLVTETGPAFLHRGERVIPKGRAGEVIFAPTVYITSTISNEMDIRILATKLNEYWVRDFERIAQTRGI